MSGRSPLLDLEYFDIIGGIAPEAMHLMCEGVTKMLLGWVQDCKKGIVFP